MRIDLTDEQYKALVELVTAGNYLINRYTEQEKREEIFDEVVERIYSGAERANCDEYFDTDDDDGSIKPNFNLADNVATYIYDYNYGFIERVLEKADLAKECPTLSSVDKDDTEDWFDRMYEKE